jgi:hypothetical protein
MAAEKISYTNPYTRRKLPGWEKLQVVVLLLLYVVLFLLYGTLLMLIYRLLAPVAKEGEVMIRPDDGAWYFVGLILSLGTSGIALKYVYRYYLHLKYTPLPYLNEGFEKRNIPGYKAIRVIAWLISAVAVFFIIHLYDSLVLVKEEKIIINEFMSFGSRRYHLREISSLQCVPVFGKETHAVDTNYRIRFRNAYTFDSRDHAFEDCRELILHLSSRTGLRVDTVEKFTVK